MKHREAMAIIWASICPCCNNRMSGEQRDGHPGWFFRCRGQKGQPFVKFEGCPVVESFPIEIVEGREREDGQ